VKRSIAIIALVLTQLVSWGEIASSQERVLRGTSSRGRVPTRMVGTSGGVPARTTSHFQVHPGETIVDEHVIEDPLSEGEYIVEDHNHMPGLVSGCDSCGGDGGCDSCSGGSSFGHCTSCNAPNRFCICFPAHGWVHAEYLMWYQKGMELPALVSTSPVGTARASAGVLGASGASVLYGNGDVLTGIRNGGRIRFGWWLDRWPGLGIEGEFVGLGQSSEEFFRQSTGSPILARPFTNALTGLSDAELVAFPGVISGSIATEVTTQLSGAAFRFRRQLCSSSGCGYSELCCQTVPTSSRLDGTLGYRFWELQESLQIREQLTSRTTTSPGSFDITDRVETRNQFNGAELGFLWQGRRGWWTLDALMRVGIGNVHQTATIAGRSVVNDNGTSTTYNNGFLAQRTNSGTFDRDQFTMVPELGATLGYQLTKRLRLTSGYSLVYWGNVIRPGDQIDTIVNPNLLAPAVTPFTGALRPEFQFQQTDYWVQGLNFGAEFRW
jgi:hypothetical protein